jgi:hypothetical protein
MIAVVPLQDCKGGVGPDLHARRPHVDVDQAFAFA